LWFKLECDYIGLKIKPNLHCNSTNIDINVYVFLE